MKTYWVGVNERPPQKVFKDEEQNVTPVKYPQFKYCVGPFKTKKEADKNARTHVNKDGTFIDPYCNGGLGR